MNWNQQLKRWYLHFTEFKWIVGIADFDPDYVLSPRKKLNIHWIKNDLKDRWFADPFILSATNDRINILVEEYFYANKKGRISLLAVNRHSWMIEEILPLIDIPTHLSFPAYYRENGKVYIYPESIKSGKLTLYEYDEEKGRALPVRILSSSPLADAVIWSPREEKLILATTAPLDNGKVLDFYPLGETPSAEPKTRFTFDTYMARNAGIPFFVKDRWIRPAQDCTRGYGYCVVLQEILERNGVFSFKEIKRLHSPLFLYQEAFHTFNVFEDKLVAVDAEGFRNGIFAFLIYHLRELFR